MTYSKFTSEALKVAKTELTKADMKFAYTTHCNFNVTVKQAVKLSLDFRADNF